MEPERFQYLTQKYEKVGKKEYFAVKFDFFCCILCSAKTFFCHIWCVCTSRGEMVQQQQLVCSYLSISMSSFGCKSLIMRLEAWFLSSHSSSRGVDLANADGTHPLSAGDSMTQLYSLHITHMHSG